MKTCVAILTWTGIADTARCWIDSKEFAGTQAFWASVTVLELSCLLTELARLD
jgi:hypothetical protein